MKPFENQVVHFKEVIRAFHAQRSAFARTSNPKCWNYFAYGGRGIKMCEGFKDKLNFMAIMGPCPEGRSLDRKNNDGHYSCGQCPECIANNWPMNCRWANPNEQALNRRPRSLLTFEGQTLHAKEWETITGISIKLIHQRKKLGWSDERILTEPPRKHPVTTKFTEEQVLKIRQRYNSSKSKWGLVAGMAKECGVLRETIRNIIKGRMWKNLAPSNTPTQPLPPETAPSSAR
jgi:hypothetical protein